VSYGGLSYGRSMKKEYVAFNSVDTGPRCGGEVIKEGFEYSGFLDRGMPK